MIPAKLAPCPTKPSRMPCRLLMTLRLAASPKTTWATTSRPNADRSTAVTPPIKPCIVSSVFFITLLL